MSIVFPWCSVISIFIDISNHDIPVYYSANYSTTLYYAQINLHKFQKCCHFNLASWPVC